MNFDQNTAASSEHANRARGFRVPKISRKRFRLGGCADYPVQKVAIESFSGITGEFVFAQLSPCEKEFLHRLAEGASYKQIAGSMNVSINTVRTYVRSVYKKLGVNSGTQAVIKYLRAHDQAASLPVEISVEMAPG